MSENDATVHAEALIMTVARAFYEDVEILLIDVLIRDKFLRDDQDMGTRLSLPPKQLRKHLQFLQDEHLVKSEVVDDLHEGGSQVTKFWYIDYNQAVKVIRLRVYLLRKRLEEAEMRARGSSMYLCPGYSKKTCNGRYTETEAQQVLDHETGFFLCQECRNAHAANPDPPPKETYTLQLVDNTKALRLAMDNIRRVDVQFSSKMINNQQMRMGIYDLMKKVRTKVASGAAFSAATGGTDASSRILTSNLPSENRMLNIGTERLEGTGRTAGNKWKKLKGKMGDTTAGNVRKYLTGSTGSNDLTYLKNALGQQISFEVEKGGGARANLLAKGGRSREKLLDAAAVRVGVELDVVTSLAMKHKRKREEEESQDEAAKERKKAQDDTLAFLKNSIGRNDDESDMEARKREEEEREEDLSDDDDDDICLVVDSDDEWVEMTEDERRAKFQAIYKKEKSRLKASANGNGSIRTGAGSVVTEDGNGDDDDDDLGVNWEEG
jgi:transcription initiation factor IIE alpha subunit